jgi:hypothetical protein
MKKLLSLFLGAIVVLSLFSGCSKPQTPPQTQFTIPSGSEPAVTEPTQPSQPTEPTQEPDSNVLEHTIKVADVQELTVTVECTTSFGERRMIYYAISNREDGLVFYEENVGAGANPYTYRSYCIVTGDDAQMFSAQGLKDFQPVDLTGEYDRADGYFRCELANLGFDYQEHFDTDGFLPAGEMTVLGRVCDVYTFAYTDHQGSGYKGEVAVDRQSGLWLWFRREIPGTQDEILMEVRSLEDNADIIPRV